MNNKIFQVTASPIFLVNYLSGTIHHWNQSFSCFLSNVNLIPNQYSFDSLFKFEYIDNWESFKQSFFIEEGKYSISIQRDISQKSEQCVYLFQVNTIEHENVEYIMFQLLSLDYSNFSLVKSNCEKQKRQPLFKSISYPVDNHRITVGDNDLFFNLFQLSPLWMMLVSTKQGIIVDANNSCLEGLGYERTNIVGKSVYDVNIHPFPQEFIDLRNEALYNQKVFRNDYVLRAFDGNLKYGLLSGEMVEMSKGSYFLATFQDMTEFRHIQKELYDSEQKFSLAFKLSPSWMGICNMNNGILIEVNERFLKGIGLSQKDAIGKSIYSLGIFTDDAGFRKTVERAKSTGNASKDIFELKTKRKGIRKGFLSLSVFKVRDQDYVILIFDDRTVFMNLQEMLVEREESYRSMFDNALAGFYRVSLEKGQILECNYHYAELLGFSSPERIVGARLNDFIINKKIFNDFINKLSLNNTATYEMPIRQRNGKEIWVINYAHRIAQRDFYEGVIVEITERKKMVELLAQNENRFRTLIENSNDVLIIVDPLGFCQYISPSISKVLGYGKRVRLKSLLSIVVDKDFEKFKNFLEKVTNSIGAHLYIDVGVKHKNGTYRTLNFTAINLLDTPEIGGILLNAYDITEKIKAQEEISQALKKEQELHRQKNHFISTVSHDFRTPITNISLNIQLLTKYLNDGQILNATKNVERINNATKRLTALINEVSLISKEQSGRLKFNPEQINSTLLVDFIIEQIDYLFQPNIIIKVDRESLRNIYADKALILHIVDNILNNAIKFTPNKGLVKFSMNIDENNNFVVEVKDSGIGIPVEEQKFLFDPYFRASNVLNINGSGLGLSIVKRCVDLHNGKIELKSIVDKGTKVTVTIPLELSEHI